MSFSLPNFNLTCDIWAPGQSPALGNPATFVGVPCQLYIISRPGSLPPYELRLDASFPGLTIQAGTALNFGNGFTISSLPGHWFGCLTRPFVVHSGFSNEYWAVLLFETHNDFLTTQTPCVLP